MMVFTFIICILLIFITNSNATELPGGQRRRMLRSIAARPGQNIPTLTLGAGAEAGICEDTGFISNLSEVLSARELVKIKTACKKKAEAKILSQSLAELTTSEVAQVIGHTILLYKNSNGEITKELV